MRTMAARTPGLPETRADDRAATRVAGRARFRSITIVYTMSIVGRLEIEWDEHIIEHLARHGISPD